MYTASSFWPDRLEWEFGTDQFGNWHYINLQVNETASNATKINTLETSTAWQQPHVGWALSKSIQALLSPKANDWMKGFYVRWLVHLMGDIHQPLHNGDFVNHDFPNGTLGGNSITVGVEVVVCAPHPYTLYLTT